MQMLVQRERSMLVHPPCPGRCRTEIWVSEKVSRYTGVSQLQLRVSRYTVQLRLLVVVLLGYSIFGGISGLVPHAGRHKRSPQIASRMFLIWAEAPPHPSTSLVRISVCNYHPGRNYYKIIPWNIFFRNDSCNPWTSLVRISVCNYHPGRNYSTKTNSLEHLFSFVRFFVNYCKNNSTR